MTLLVCIVVSFYISNMNVLPAIFKLEASAALTVPWNSISSLSDHFMEIYFILTI